MIERIKIIFLFYFFILCRSIVVMGWQRHSGRRNGTLGRNFEIVSLLETKRLELSSGDRGFAESDRRGESVAFRARDGGAARPQRFAPTDISFSRNHGNHRFPPAWYFFFLFIHRRKSSPFTTQPRRFYDRFRSSRITIQRRFACYFICSTDTNHDVWRLTRLNSYRVFESRGEESRERHSYIVIVYIRKWFR